MLDRLDLPQGTLDLLILRTLAQRHPGKSVGRTYSSILQDNGEDVKVVQDPLRHSSSKMTLGCLRAGAHPNQASGAAQGGRDDPGRSQCAAECTAGNWGAGLSLSA
jgi:hypothetical protein